MIYAVITSGSLVAVFIHYFYIKKKQLQFSKPWFLLELPVFWILEFCVFYVKSYNDYGYFWPGENKTLPTILTGIAAGAVLAVLAILINPFVHKSRTDKYRLRCLFTVKGFQFFPLNSFIYAFAGTIVVIAALFVVENAVKNPTLEKWAKEDSLVWAMDKEKNYDNTPYPIIKVKGTKLDKSANLKILVLGDSFVFGYGYSNYNYMWWNMLSNELKSRGYNCDIYGVGYEAASTYNELEWLTKTSMVADLNPDIILIGYVTNDPDLNYSKESVIPQYGTLGQVLNVPFKNVITRLWPDLFSTFDYKLSEKLGPLGLFSGKIGYQYATWELKQIKGRNLAQYNAHVIEPLGKFAASSGIPVALVTTPHMPDISYFEPRYAPVLPLFEKAGIKTYNMLYDFCKKCSADKYKSNYFINPADPHPGTTDTWFYSKYIADMLESNYPEILGKKTLTGKEVYNINVNDWMPVSLNTKTVSESGTSAQYIISYPAQNSENTFLTMPVNENYIKLNFKYPVDISTVSIAGKKLDSATLYVTGINKDLGFDDQIMHKLGKKSGHSCKWTDGSVLRVTSLCIHAVTSDGSGENLTVNIACKEGAVSP